MLRFLKRLLDSPKKRYERNREILSDKNETEREKLAKDKSTHPEMLYYMTDDPSDKVREAVASNASTPAHAGPKLAQDKNTEVRLALATRLVNLLPQLSEEEHGKLYSFAVQSLGLLAEDEVLKIRRALSTSLKDLTSTPPHIAVKLAKDVEKEVAEPMLRYCMKIADDALLDILEHHPEPWAARAIAQRKTVSERVSAGVFKTLDTTANKLLLNNEGSEISDETLVAIIEHARDCPEWHKSIALRRDLTYELARKLAGFANKAVLVVLEKRKNFDRRTRKKIGEMVKRRIAFKENAVKGEDVKHHVKRYGEAGKLNEETISDALAWHDYKFVVEALSQMSGISRAVAQKIVNMQNARALVALSWKAGLNMRLAVELQKQLANIQPRDLVYARGGTDYPMPKDEMDDILELLGKS